MRISLIISEENKALERDISRLIDVNAFYMRYYPGHGETPRREEECSRSSPR